MARIKFRKGMQAKLLINCVELSGLSWLEIAKKIDISQRTLLDWRREKYTISHEALNWLVKLSGKSLKIPQYKILPDYWSVKKAAKMGGQALAAEYGGPGTPTGRKKGGRNSQKNRRLHPESYQNCNLRKIIRIPKRSSDLAEFIGIFLGDGGFSNSSQITISFNKENGRNYARKVSGLIERLFKIKSVVYPLSSPKKVIRLVITSANLVDFLSKDNKIKRGNKVKNQVNVPSWIRGNVLYSRSCLRGLIDTDGGVYYHQHANNGRSAFNMGLCFSNKSRPLVDFVRKTLRDMQFHPKISQGFDKVYLYREAEVLRYEEEIGFSNIHQVKRLKEYLKIKKRKGA